MEAVSRAAWCTFHRSVQRERRSPGSQVGGLSGRTAGLRSPPTPTATGRSSENIGSSGKPRKSTGPGQDRDVQGRPSLKWTSPRAEFLTSSWISRIRPANRSRHAHRFVTLAAVATNGFTAFAPDFHYLPCGILKGRFRRAGRSKCGIASSRSQRYSLFHCSSAGRRRLTSFRLRRTPRNRRLLRWRRMRSSGQPNSRRDSALRRCSGADRPESDRHYDGRTRPIMGRGELQLVRFGSGGFDAVQRDRIVVLEDGDETERSKSARCFPISSTS